VVANYLPNKCKNNLSQSSLFFNQAMQWHFKVLLDKESQQQKTSLSRIMTAQSIEEASQTNSSA